MKRMAKESNSNPRMHEIGDGNIYKLISNQMSRSISCHNCMGLKSAQLEKNYCSLNYNLNVHIPFIQYQY